MYYSIGEFSKLTNLTPKMLKLYHEMDLLVPAKVDEFTKYRFYNDSNIETANLINFFKRFDFSLAEIKEIVDNQDDESVLAELLEKQKDVIEDKITKYNFVMGLINEKLKRRTKMTEINSASKQRSRFWKIFAKLLMSNIPIAESLEIAGRSADEKLKSVIESIIIEIKNGGKLHVSLCNNKAVFTNLEILVITTAEKDNHIAECANGLGDILDEFGFPDKNEERKNTRSNYWKMYSALVDLGNTIVGTMPVAAEWADERVSDATDAMLNELNSGSDISTTLRIRPDFFTKLELEVVRIGEWYGILDQTIKKLPSIVRMIEETDGEIDKRRNFWRVLGDFEGADYTAVSNEVYDYVFKAREEFNKNLTDETKEKKRLPERSDYNFYRETILIALFVADDKLKAISEDILKDITNNKTLSSVMQKHPDIFQEFEIRLIALGEKNGNVGKAALDLVEIL